MSDGSYQLELAVIFDRGPIALEAVRSPVDFARWLANSRWRSRLEPGGFAAVPVSVLVPWRVRDALVAHLERHQDAVSFTTHGELIISGVTIQEAPL